MKCFTKIFVCIVLAFLFNTANIYPQDSFNMRLLANLNEHPYLDGYSACWGYIADDGREYAILGCYSGTSFIDITDTNNIHEVDFLSSTNPSSYGNYWREMKTYSHYAYIVSEVESSRIQIVDLQYLPDSIKYVGKVQIPTYSTTHTISQSGPYLYLNGCNSEFTNGGIVVLDLSTNPESPVLRGKWTLDYVHDCRVVNDTIWACNMYSSSISIISAEDKNNLATINSWSTIPNYMIHNIALTNDRKYAFTTHEYEYSPAGSLAIWDVSDIGNVIFIDNWRPQGDNTSMIHNIEIYDSLAVVGHYTAGVRVLNISDPENPTEIAYYDTYPNSNETTFLGIWGVYMFPSGKIIASDLETGLYVLRMNNTLTNISYENNISNKEFSLCQNYPNPFNPYTKLSFNLSSNSKICLKVYDSNGKLISTLINNEMKPSGFYEIDFDGSKLASGIYFYKLETGNNSITRKMILVK